MELHTITGPPGTGKTTTVAQRVRSHIDEGVSRDKVLVASLTRAAAREAARVVSLPDRQVGTWHSFAYHGLGEPQLTEQHMKDWNEAYPKWKQSGGDLSGEVYVSPIDCVTGDKLALEYSRKRAAGDDAMRGHSEYKLFAAAWEDWKHQCGYADFNDIIDRARDLDTAPGAPDVIYCDEAQDLSLQEASLIARWGEKAQVLCLAGDDHQAIYGWRGSDPVEVRKVWSRIAAQARKHDNLERSYRVPAAVHHVAMQQMQRCRSIPPVLYQPRDEAGMTRSAPSFELDDGTPLLRLAFQEAREDETIMFIASCGYMLQPILKGLEYAGEPWHNPWRKAARAWNPMEASKGVSFYERVLAFMAASQTLWGSDAKFWSAEQLKLWVQPLPVAGIFERSAKTIIGKLDNKTTTLEQVAEGMRSWFTASALERITQCDLGWYLDQIAPNKRTMAGKILTQMVKQRGVEPVVKTPRVIVGTVHSLKGSEADLVCVCPDISSAARRAAECDQRIREEINRVFYVAVTRARRALFLCAHSSNTYMPF